MSRVIVFLSIPARTSEIAKIAEIAESWVYDSHFLHNYRVLIEDVSFTFGVSELAVSMSSITGNEYGRTIVDLRLQIDEMLAKTSPELRVRSVSIVTVLPQETSINAIDALKGDIVSLRKSYEVQGLSRGMAVALTELTLQIKRETHRLKALTKKMAKESDSDLILTNYTFYSSINNVNTTPTTHTTSKSTEGGSS